MPAGNHSIGKPKKTNTENEHKAVLLLTRLLKMIKKISIESKRTEACKTRLQGMFASGEGFGNMTRMRALLTVAKLINDRKNLFFEVATKTLTLLVGRISDLTNTTTKIDDIIVQIRRCQSFLIKAIQDNRCCTGRPRNSALRKRRAYLKKSCDVGYFSDEEGPKRHRRL
eukprot:TRINITY_DN8983_c0_g1_i1.p1 TRINITY_DN8983_c0_g1~~TRINITY_DN8983_c0_g1_i1.p1  ORF type:complete len:170 (+),score=16.19 TRINITY_DN8983_c0_g1_i1:59-568(+)